MGGCQEFTRLLSGRCRNDGGPGKAKASAAALKCGYRVAYELHLIRRANRSFSEYWGKRVFLMGYGSLASLRNDAFGLRLGSSNSLIPFKNGYDACIVKLPKHPRRGWSWSFIRSHMVCCMRLYRGRLKLSLRGCLL